MSALSVPGAALSLHLYHLIESLPETQEMQDSHALLEKETENREVSEKAEEFKSQNQSALGVLRRTGEESLSIVLSQYLTQSRHSVAVSC